MDVIFLIYGLAFLALGLVLTIWPKQDSHFDLAALSRWLAGFAFVHGTLEWMDLWRVVHGDNPVLAAWRPFTLLASYLLLYEFGRRLLAASLSAPSAPVRRLLSPNLHIVLLACVSAGSLAAGEFLRDLGIWSRYLYGFTGSAMAGVGFWLYCRHRVRPVLDDAGFQTVRRPFLVAGSAFIAYAVLGGLVVPSADWAPAAWLNQDGFRAATGIPVQLFRAACAVLAAVSVTFILRLFHIERSLSIRAALNRADRLAHHNRLLLESVAEGIFGVDTHGRTTFINPTALAMLGYTADELIGVPIHRLTHHHHADGSEHRASDCPTRHTLIDGITRHIDHDTFWRKDGTSFPVESHTARIAEQGETLGAVVVFQDISERLRIEAELEQHRHHLESLVVQRTADLEASEQRSRLILAASANGLYGIDTAGNFIFVNPAGNRLLGYAEGELIGRPVHASLHHSHVDATPFPAEECPMLATLKTGQAVSNDDDLFWRADGTPLQVATVAQPMIKDGRILGAVVSFVDIRQRKALDAARDRALAEAERLARVKSEFLANMSHEIRTPLNGVLGMAQIGLREAGGHGRAGATFAKIIQSGKLLLGIVNDILDYSKIESGKLRIESVPMELVAVLRDIATVMHERAQARNLAFRIHKAPDLPRACLGDPLRLGQILINLLGNAIKFTETGSVALAIERAGEELIFTITDTGIGMPPEQIERLFRPFEQADGSTTRRFGGTGLGLAITYRLVQQMGGHIGVESTPGRGSRFEVRLPCREVELAAPTASHATAVESRLLAGVTILVAEDNDINQEVIEDMLASNGAHVVLVGDGRAAVAEVADKGRGAYDIALMDIQMPEMDGLEATRRILEIDPELPVIGQTAHTLAEEKAACLAAGMAGHIAKPLVPEELVRLILHHARNASTADRRVIMAEKTIPTGP